MATKFNSTNFPFLRVIGRPFNVSDFKSSVFSLMADKRYADAIPEFRKAQREWYASHKDKFGDDVCLIEKFKQIDGQHSVGLFKEKHLFEHGAEHSGMICYTDGIYGCYMYTIKFHSAESLKSEELMFDGLEDKELIELRVMAVGSVTKSKAMGISSGVAFAYLNNDGDGWEMDYSYSVPDADSNYQKDSIGSSYKGMFANILALQYSREKQAPTIDIPLPHGVAVDGVKYINYSPFTVCYVKGYTNEGFKSMNRTQSEISHKITSKDAVESQNQIANKSNKSIAAGECWELTSRGEWFIVRHDPIDYTVTPKDVEDYDHSWGLENIFRKVREGSGTYNVLRAMFRDDGPLFIGGMYIPVAFDGYVSIHMVYVVRCDNNGNTYFVSKEKDALATFM